mgnify:CR=1 FL=1
MVPMGTAHWDEAYGRLGATGVSWFRAEQPQSLAMLDMLPATPASAIDIGGGASTLAGLLRARGVDDVTVLDISPAALALAQRELGDRADRVHWVASDITSWQPDRPRELWHDRAVFHFLTDEADRGRYRAALAACVAPGGHVIAAAFAPDGPEQCSGLPVCRYSPDQLVAALGDDLVLVHADREVHTTPSGNPQAFTWVLAHREPRS